MKGRKYGADHVSMYENDIRELFNEGRVISPDEKAPSILLVRLKI